VRRIDITPTPDHARGAYRYGVEFESTFTSGRALLHSYATPDRLLAGRDISVETSQDRIADFRVLLDQDQSIGQFAPLATACDYEVTGRVVFLDQEVFDVEVGPGGCLFTIGFDEITPITVNKGDWVTFNLMGLTLWDEHL